MNGNTQTTAWQNNVSKQIQVSLNGAASHLTPSNQSFDLKLMHLGSKRCLWEQEFSDTNGLSTAVFSATQNKNGLFEVWFGLEGNVQGPQWSAVGIQGLFNTIKLFLDSDFPADSSIAQGWPKEILVTFSPSVPERSAFYIAPELSENQFAMMAGMGESDSGSGSESSTSTSSESSESGGSLGSGGSGGSGGDGGGSEGGGSSSSTAEDDTPEPRTEVGGCGDVSNDPIRYVDGQIQLQAVDVASRGFGQYWAHERSYSNQLARNVNMGNGYCWCLPYLSQIVSVTITRYALVGNMNNVIYFDKDLETGLFTTLNGNLERLTYDDVNEVFYLLSPDGTYSKFHGYDDTSNYGKLIYSRSPGGNETTVVRTTSSFSVERSITLQAGTFTQRFTYTTESQGAHAGQITACFLQVTDPSENVTNIAKANYTYYDGSSDNGSLNDLKTVSIQKWDTDTSAWIDQGTTYYRYYKDNESDGFKHGLKYVVLPGSYEQMVSDSIDPLTTSNTTIAQYADNYFEFDTSQRVVLERNKGGALTFTFSYTENPATSSSTSGGSTTYNPNSWVKKTVQTLPDSSQNILYFNGAGQTMLEVKKSGNDEWCWFKKYDGNGRVILQAEPSAISGYDEQYTDLLHYSGGSYQYLNNSTGLIHLYDFYTTTGSGAAEGYPSFTKIQNGENGTPIKLSKTEYSSHSANGNTIYLPSKEISYPDESNQSTTISASYSYTFHTGTLQVKQKTITLPVISTSQNGSGTANTRIEVHDTEDNLTWVKDELGFITKMVYDNTTGALIQLIEDVDTTQQTDEPAGWVTPSNGGKNLVTDYEVDDLGRVTQVLGPAHSIDINGQTTSIRTATWNVYKQGSSVDEVWQARGYQSGPSNNYQYTLINPVSINKTDKYGNALERIQATRSSTSGKLLPTDSFPQSSFVSWITRQYTGCCLLESERVYHTIPSSGTGSSGTNYDQSSYGYDNMQRQNRSTSPGGTISFTVFDVRNNPYQVYVGTDDTGATQQDPTGGGATGNNMVLVSQNEYDNGADGGDNNLTKQTLYVDSSETRITSMSYDWRDRPVDTDGEIDAFQRKYYDNLNRVTKVEQYHTTAAGVLLGRSETKYDDLGRVYQSIQYAVDPSTGTIGNSLVNNTWYDATGKVLKQLPAGSDLFTKLEYDGLGRQTASYTGYDLDETSYADAGTVTGDTILEQAETVYDDAGNVIENITRMRYHDAPASQTGALQDPTTAPKARVTFQASYPDAIGRVIAIADYGTNGGTALSRSSTVPTRSDTVLVTTSAFDSAGRVYQLIDPAAMESRKEYDSAGRTIKVIENYQATASSSSSSSAGSDPSNDTNRTTRTTYTPDGSIATLTAENAETGNQVTTYTYGTTLSDSEIASSTLLRTETYPDSVDGNDVITYAYNRQGQPIKRTDQLGTIHEIDYDKLGRTTQDRVTTLGTGVDGAVRRIGLSYDARGLNTEIGSYKNATAGQGTLVNEVQFAYNDFRQAITSYQSHAGEVNVSTSPKVQTSFANGSDNTIRPASLTYPDGRVLSYSYGSSGSIDDATSRVAAIVDDDLSATHLAEYSYLGMRSPVIADETEPDVKYTLVGTAGGNDPDTGDIYRGMDRFGRIKESLWYDYGASADKANIQYGYDRASNRTWRYNPLDTTHSFDEFYSYDGLQRLKETDRGELNAPKTGINMLKFAQSWSLDETGNWKGFQQDNTGNGTWDLEQTRTSNTANEITDITETAGSSWITPAYNKAGNMTTIPQPTDLTASFTATYDAWNRLVKIMDSSNTVAEYAYDGRNFRIIQKSYVSGSLDETRHLYYTDSWQTIEERIDSETSPERQFVWGMRYIDDLFLRDRDTTGNGTLDERLYALQDGNWNVTAICDENGDVQERYAYDSYGSPTFLTPSFGSRSSSSFNWETFYAGYRWESASELFHVRNRAYHSFMGCWTQRDPVGYTDSLSLYEYEFGKPFIFTDPYGDQAYMPNWNPYEENVKWHKIQEQKRLNELHNTMKWMTVIADSYAQTGDMNRTLKRFNDLPQGYIQDPVRPFKFPAKTYQSTTNKMIYSWENYNRIGLFNVDAGQSIMNLMGSGTAHNYPVIPGFQISNNQFWNENPISAIGTLTHEPQHDLGLGPFLMGIGGHANDGSGYHIHGVPAGTYLEGNIEDLANWIERFIDPQTRDRKDNLLEQIIRLSTQEPPVAPPYLPKPSSSPVTPKGRKTPSCPNLPGLLREKDSSGRDIMPIGTMPGGRQRNGKIPIYK
ncbi:hypothetical protein Pan241w_41460 [Gimesia alba]|uniref:tRNA3(Ser)-specific nuclease WapA n=1 Tax=Gimesia alba TaxID=2527973 RepID=A0A517RJI3_9PLAN|nr:RHS repeat-associated core domain-containing protein [Gimesia alba]QDT44041.1 hypothetical protein Pan241w_41460 [Gimesia alba]